MRRLTVATESARGCSVNETPGTRQNWEQSRATGTLITVDMFSLPGGIVFPQISSMEAFTSTVTAFEHRAFKEAGEVKCHKGRA